MSKHEDLFWKVVNSDSPYKAFVTEYKSLTEKDRTILCLTFERLQGSDEYEDWLRWLFEEDDRCDPIIDEDYEDGRISPSVFAGRRFAERVNDEIYELRKILKFHMDLYSEEEVDAPKEKEHVRIKWLGKKNELAYVFRQLLRLERKDGGFYMDTQKSNLSRFLIANFDVFKNDSLKTVNKYFEENNTEKNPVDTPLKFPSYEE